MPGFDKTGPEGKGPMTGRKMGRCTDTANTDNNNIQEEDRYRNGYGRGMGNRWRHGRGNGRGFGRRRAEN